MLHISSCNLNISWNILRILFHDLCSVADQHAKCHWTFQGRSGPRLSTSELLDHLRHGHSVLLTNEVQKTESMILRDVCGRWYWLRSARVGGRPKTQISSRRRGIEERG